MPYTIDDAIYKLNQMSNENAEFREEVRRTTTELQQELNSLKNEVTALKNRYIRETMNLVEERGDNEVVEMGKTDSANSALCDLERMAKTVCGAMANAVSQDPSLDKSKITWGKVPTHYQERGLKTLIATAKQFDFHLDRSEQNTAEISSNVEESIEQERHLAQTSHDSEHSAASESRAMASKRRRQETLNEGQSAQQSAGPQMRRRKQQKVILMISITSF
ncbi:hypothetical protein G6F56_003461 [Rhizopus delemar]|nr:hypothetical protein G6F56_003461 [Rhizopus delemar]